MKKNTVKVIIALLFLAILSLPKIYGYLMDSKNETNVFKFASRYNLDRYYYYIDENDNRVTAKANTSEKVFDGTVVSVSGTLMNLDYNKVEYFVNNNLYTNSSYTVHSNALIDEVYTLNRYTITYNLNGGNVSGNPTVYTAMSGTININNPTKAGYDFVGWTWAGNSIPVTNLSFNGSDKENKTFTANWIAQGYNLTTGQTINPLILSTVQHVVFGKTSDYTTEIQGITATHVGATANDLIYFYHNTSTKTVYILADGLIKFNAASNYMFSNKNNIQDITFANIDTSAATSMADMFSKCTGLTTLDLSLFDTHNVTDMTSMFGSDRNLRTIYASDLWSTDNVSASNGMFQSCNNLRGGAGTSYNNGHQDKEYARIDTQNVHGYFTGV